MPAYMLIRVDLDDPAQLKAYQAATLCFCRAGSARHVGRNPTYICFRLDRLRYS